MQCNAGIYVFNQRPAKGIEYLRSRGVLDPTPRSVGVQSKESKAIQGIAGEMWCEKSCKVRSTAAAEFLWEAPRHHISKYAIGQYLARDQDALGEYVALFDYGGMHIHDALAAFLATFSLVGEGMHEAHVNNTPR
jgi:hypothetical protein